MQEVTSRHLRGATELMLIVPIRKGLVQSEAQATLPAVAMPYATRLSTFLGVLFQLRKSVVERQLLEGKGPLESLQSIYTTQWAIEDDPVAPRLIVTACFDRSWEDYVGILVERTGHLLDAIFCHCEGYAGRSCADGVEKFAAFLREHQRAVSFFHTGMPDVTLDDIRLARKQRRFANADSAGAIIRSPLVEDETLPATAADVAALAKTVGLLRTLFPSDSFDQKRSFAQILDNAWNQLFPAAPATPALATLASRPGPAETDLPNLDDAELQSIQAGILTGYNGQTHGCALLFEYEDGEGAERFMSYLSERVTTHAEASADGTRPYVNVYLTYPGLRRLGLPDATLALFPKEFREGMKERAGLVGDIVPSSEEVAERLPKMNASDAAALTIIDPERVDVIVVVQRRIAGSEQIDREKPDVEWTNDHPLKPDVDAFAGHGGRLLHVQALRRAWLRTESNQPYYREHFGFRDSGDVVSGSQPVPKATLNGVPLIDKTPAGDQVNLGDFLLGYPDSRGETALAALPGMGSESLFKNGSFLVMRKLRQDVAAFNSFADANTRGCPFSSQELKSIVVGRDIETGKSLTGEDGNDFDFAKTDPFGDKVPLHAHMRRANPRIPGVPRILRRGFSYGLPYELNPVTNDRGMLFMAYNTNIGRQFEVLQRWINGGNSTGLSSAQNDVLCGATQASGPVRWVQKDGSRFALQSPAGPLVTLSWGFYLFAPSKIALKTLAEPALPTTTVASVDTGETEVQRLKRLSGVEAIAGWATTLEGPQTKALAAHVWAAIRENHGGILDAAPYGFLVGTAQYAQQVLGNDGKTFSVREYWRRLRECIGEHYLGLDPETGTMLDPNDDDLIFEARSHAGKYAAFSARGNAAIRSKVDVSTAYEVAHDLAQATLVELDALKPIVGWSFIDVQAFAAAVVGRLAHQWVGTPLPTRCNALDVASFTQHFAALSIVTFQTWPSNEGREDARKHGAVLREAYAAKRRATGVQSLGVMATELAKNLNEEQVDVALIGAIVGFAAPAIECIRATLEQWLNDGTLSGLRASTNAARDAATERLITEALTAHLLAAPVPSILYRVAVDGAAVTSETDELTDIPPRSLVVVGLQSLGAELLQKNESGVDLLLWMFGGEHRWEAGQKQSSPHGCPARRPLLRALAGVLAAVVELDVKREGRTAISY